MATTRVKDTQIVDRVVEILKDAGTDAGDRVYAWDSGATEEVPRINVLVDQNQPRNEGENNRAAYIVDHRIWCVLVGSGEQNRFASQNDTRSVQGVLDDLEDQVMKAILKSDTTLGMDADILRVRWSQTTSERDNKQKIFGIKYVQFSIWSQMQLEL